MGHRRIRITDVVTDGPPLQVQVDHIDTPRDQGSNPTVKAYANEILACIREIVKLNPMFREHVQYFVQTADLNDPWRLVRGMSEHHVFHVRYVCPSISLVDTGGLCSFLDNQPRV